MSFRFLVFLSMGFTLCGQAIQGAAKEPAEGAPFVLSHDYDLYSEIPELVGQGHLRSKVKPAAVTLGALQWLTSENGKPPQGWYRVQLNGWMVAKGKEGRPHMSQGKDGWWNAGAKDSDGTFHAGTLNIHSDTVLDAGSIVGTLREGASVYVSQQRLLTAGMGLWGLDGMDQRR